MTEPADSDDVGLVEQSRRGWPTFGTERDVWIPCPAKFGEGDDQDSWAQRYATQWWERSGAEHGLPQVVWLAKILADLRELTYRPGRCHLAVIHLPPGRPESSEIVEPLPVDMGVWQLRGEREARLRLLTNAADPDAIEPPIVEEFGSDKLGTGLKTLRYARLDDGSLYGAVNYAFRSEQHETDLRFSCSCPDLGLLQAVIPDVDELARTTGLRSLDRD